MRSLFTYCAPFAFRFCSSFSVHISFTYLRSAFRIRSLCVRSAFGQHAFTVHSLFAHHSSGKVERFTDCTLIINHFIIKYILYDMVTGAVTVELLDVPPLLFHVTLYMLIHLIEVKYTEVKYQLKQFFLHEYQIWRTAEWNGQCFTKRRIEINHVSITQLKSSSFPTLTQRHVTT